MRGHRIFLLAVFFSSLAISSLILFPFLHSLILAGLLAGLLQPLYGVMLKRLKGKKSWAALFSVVIATGLIIIPAGFLIIQLITESVDTINHINAWIEGGNLQELLAGPRVDVFGGWMKKLLAKSHLDTSELQKYLIQYSKEAGEFLLSRSAGLLGGIVGVVFHFFVLVFALFYFIRDGRDMVGEIKTLAPLKTEHEDYILSVLRDVSRATLIGNLLTALAQGTAGAIGLAIAGIPALLLGVLIGFSSLIPFVGTAIVWIPTIGYLLLIGDWTWAVFLLLWSTLFVGAIDNFMRPFLIHSENTVSPFYVFLSVIGGVHFFGVMGLLYGPLFLGLTKGIIIIYKDEFRQEIAR